MFNPQDKRLPPIERGQQWMADSLPSTSPPLLQVLNPPPSSSMLAAPSVVVIDQIDPRHFFRPIPVVTDQIEQQHLSPFMSFFTEQVDEAICEADVQVLGSYESCREDAQENNQVVTPVSPYINMEFSSHEDNFYNAYAKFTGFGTRKGHLEWSRNKDVMISKTFMCDKEGFKYMKDKREEGKDVFCKADKKFGCKAKMTINLDRSSGKWIVKAFIQEHNGHELTTPSKVMKHFSHQTLRRGPATAKFVDKLNDRGVRPTTICKVLNVSYGKGILLDHGIGLVIGETAVVGNRVSLMQASMLPFVMI